MNRVRDTIARMLKAGSEGPEFEVIYGITDHEYAIGQMVHHHALLCLHRCRLFRPDRDHSPAARPELSRRPGSYYGKGVYGKMQFKPGGPQDDTVDARVALQHLQCVARRAHAASLAAAAKSRKGASSVGLAGTASTDPKRRQGLKSWGHGLSRCISRRPW